MIKTIWLSLALLFSFVTLTHSKSLTYSDRYTIYNSIDFDDNPVDQQVFNFAFKGYLNLLDQDKLVKDNLLSIIDYSKHSKDKRFCVFDLHTKSM